jgi:hypothetical protein
VGSNPFKPCTYSPCGARTEWIFRGEEVKVFKPISKPNKCGWHVWGIVMRTCSVNDPDCDILKSPVLPRGICWSRRTSGPDCKLRVQEVPGRRDSSFLRALGPATDSHADTQSRSLTGSFESFGNIFGLNVFQRPDRFRVILRSVRMIDRPTRRPVEAPLRAPKRRPARTTASDGGMKVSIGRHVHEGPANVAFRGGK